MKKIFLFDCWLVCLLSIQSLNGQFEKGKILAGVTSTLGIGDFGTDLMSMGILPEKSIKTINGELKKVTRVVLALILLPRGGYFIMDNLAVGIDLLVELLYAKRIRMMEINTLKQPWE